MGRLIRPPFLPVTSSPSLLRSRRWGASRNALPPPPTAASTRTTFLSIRVANHRVAHIILSQTIRLITPRVLLVTCDKRKSRLLKLLFQRLPNIRFPEAGHMKKLFC